MSKQHTHSTRTLARTNKQTNKNGSYFFVNSQWTLKKLTSECLSVKKIHVVCLLVNVSFVGFVGFVVVRALCVCVVVCGGVGWESSCWQDSRKESKKMRWIATTKKKEMMMGEEKNNNDKHPNRFQLPTNVLSQDLRHDCQEKWRDWWAWWNAGQWLHFLVRNGRYFDAVWWGNGNNFFEIPNFLPTKPNNGIFFSLVLETVQKEFSTLVCAHAYVWKKKKEGIGACVRKKKGMLFVCGGNTDTNVTAISSTTLQYLDTTLNMMGQWCRHTHSHTHIHSLTHSLLHTLTHTLTLLHTLTYTRTHPSGKNSSTNNAFITSNNDQQYKS